jgi:hypothetical protein
LLARIRVDTDNDRANVGGNLSGKNYGSVTAARSVLLIRLTVTHGRFAMATRICFTILLLSSLLWGRNAEGVADGSNWKQFSEAYRIAWIDGFVTAMSDAQLSTALLCAFQLNLGTQSTEGKACIAQAQGFNFGKIKYGRFLDGMDAFYKDFRNTEYPINGAMRIVRDQINGRSNEDIEKELAAWRQCQADSSKCGITASPAKPAVPAPKQ